MRATLTCVARTLVGVAKEPVLRGVMPHAPAIPGTISCMQLQPVARALPALGLDPARVFGRCGVSLEQLADANARLPAGVELEVWDAVVAMSGDPLIGLKVADLLDAGALGAYEYMLRNSETLRACLERAQRYVRLIDDHTTLELVESAEQYAVRQVRAGGYPHPAQGTECLFAGIFRVLHRLLPQGFARAVCFQHPRRGELREYTERFRCPVRFEQAYDEICLHPGFIDRKLEHADPRLGEVLEEQVQRMLAEIPNEDPWSHRARTQLAQLLTRADASLPRLAEAMHMSTRTLRRRLLEQQTSYKQMLDEVRRDMALHYVARTQESFDQIAGRLGFAEASAFYRAFKRWSNSTPAAYRSKL